MNWNRLLWGVELTGSLDDKPILIGQGWHNPAPQGLYPTEPTRALLFTTRRAAREWCAAKMAGYKGRSDCCARWRFRAVRVRETVRQCARKGGR